LTDPTFHGIYHDKQAHEDDFEEVIERARKARVKKMMVTGSDLEESKKAVELARKYRKYRHEIEVEDSRNLSQPVSATPPLASIHAPPNPSSITQQDPTISSPNSVN
jgi:hypothetical protein